MKEITQERRSTLPCLYCCHILVLQAEEKGRNPLVAGALWFSISVIAVGGTRGGDVKSKKA